MIIDTHTHFYDPTRPQGVPWPPEDNDLLFRTVLPDHFKEVSQPEGVTGTVVVEASAWVDDNQWILDLAQKEPCIVGFVGHIDPGTPDFGKHLDRLSENPLFRGIRVGDRFLADPEQGTILTDLAELSEKGLELDVISNSADFSGILTIADRLPEMSIVINHIAHVPVDGNDPDGVWLDNMRASARRPNLYCKVSAVIEQSKVQPAPAGLDYYLPTLNALWETFGEDRLVYGSNWPVCERSGDYATQMSIVRAFFANKGDEASGKFFWKNAQAAYQWINR